ncbi:MAG: arginine N-succinyltransferase [Kordiimonadaceae bacterium]|nr:arginine N-succinyltransferase [Kordiimonadaceae bacterium]
MFVVRPARLDDLDGLQALAKQAGNELTTLPDHRPTLKKKIVSSVHAFSSKPAKTEKRTYLLVLEDLATGAIAGTSALVVGLGYDKPFYTYRLLHQTQVSYVPDMRVDTELLQLSNDFLGATEVATLFLAPEYRKGKLGKLLSKARYMLMAAHPDHFSDTIISEIRGWLDENGNSPFWESIGRHFFGMNFKEADKINGQGNSQFISDLMPKFPIYTSLLPKEARNVIGKTHDMATAAIRLLEREGFRFTGAVDIFDAGPAMEAHKKLIWTIRKCEVDTLGGIVEGVGRTPTHLAANGSLDTFRVVKTNVIEGGSGSSGTWLPSKAAEALGIKVGDPIHYSPLEQVSDDFGV